LPYLSERGGESVLAWRAFRKPPNSLAATSALGLGPIFKSAANDTSFSSRSLTEGRQTRRGADIVLPNIFDGVGGLAEVRIGSKAVLGSIPESGPAECQLRGESGL
jgi:hypothetical protein